MAISVDMLTWKGRIPQDPLLDDRLQATNECWEKGNQSAPGMSPFLVVQFGVVSLETIYTPSTKTDSTCCVCTYLSVHTHT